MNQKVDSQLHTVASPQLQKEIDELLKATDDTKEKKKSEDSFKYDGGGSRSAHPVSE